ncbi:MAG: DPP IV N-terminal domain-containing protein [Phycisphaeraceae bacterium]|nr:DPP IV N-terminal domain-containing protein [Phycisphaeraceae bacterium]
MNHINRFPALGAAILCSCLLGCESSPRIAASKALQSVGSVQRTDHAAAASEDFLARYVETGGFRRGTPTNITPTPDGDAILFLRSAPDSRVRNLYAVDPATGQERVLLTAEDLLGGADEVLTDEELARRERQRLSARGIVTYSLSEDGSTLLVPLSDTLYLVDRASMQVTSLRSDNGYPIDPRLSPDGEWIAAVRDGDLFITNTDSRIERRLTTGAGGPITHGLAEFVAQEEMDRDRGYWFSPDSGMIAYQRTDTSMVETARIMDPTNPTAPPREWPYPRAGTDNAQVTLGVIPVTGGSTVWVDWDHDRYPYLAKVVWAKDAPLTVLVQNREQTEEILYAVDPYTGDTTELLTERDPAWVNIDPQMPRWIKGGEMFLWTTEREGAWTLELRRKDGGLISRLTDPAFGYRGFIDDDPAANGVIIAASADPLDRHLWRVHLAPTAGPPKRLTFEPGQHSAVFAGDGSCWVHTVTGLDRTTQRLIKDAKGLVRGEIRSLAEDPGLEIHDEFHAVGPRAIRAHILYPESFDESRSYPVIVSVYGGPHVQMVTRGAARSELLDQWIANQGYLVVSFDGRGTPNRGRDWERAIKYDLITIPLEDQVEALRALAQSVPQIDLGRVGITGWSFGGYFSAHTILQRPDVFHAAVIGAPVADWRDYDTHYTERYMGLPDANPIGYDHANVLTHAHRVDRPILIFHGTADDNVYFTNSLKLSDALTRAGQEHEFIPLSGQTHRVSDQTLQLRQRQRMMSFFNEALRP